jgi:hypothetical protein
VGFACFNTFYGPKKLWKYLLQKLSR